MQEQKPDQAIRLTEARIAKGFKSARAAAQYYGWPYYTYIQHEQGVRGINKAASRYAKAFNVSTGWLLTGEGQGIKTKSTTALSDRELEKEVFNALKDISPEKKQWLLRILGTLKDEEE
ncbi:XRE family transcriptional regulator [Bartonella grahamii]|uniref:XRE family transcriptional regulator n=1 Tax=Bartonella grahamii TaxID=33045 RepID=UPI001ABB0FAC|nr:XRE family transcriptional regulator [Bartonella grahamii]